MLFSGPVAFYKREKSENFACFVEVRAIVVYLYKFKLCKSIQNFCCQLPSNFHFDPRSKKKSSYSPTDPRQHFRAFGGSLFPAGKALASGR